MFTRILLICAVLCLQAVDGAEHPAEIIAIVDLKFLRETDFTAAVMCYGEQDDDCGVWATHYLWEAKVLRVLAGQLPATKFRVLHGRHALLRKDRKNLIVSLEPIDPKTSLGATYVVSEVADRPNLACFDGAVTLPTVKLIGEDYENSCIDIDALPEEDP